MCPKKIKYPRYAREQNLACKLTDEDIKKIKILYNERGWLKVKIAEKFNVSCSAIGYWLMSDRERKERERRRYLLWGKDRDRKEKQERQRRSKKRKYRLMVEFRDYTHQFQI